jgi:diacylglycerol kinase (ATP)
MAKALIIHNPAAGMLKDPSLVGFIKDTLKAKGFSVKILPTPFTRESLLAHLQAGVDRVLVAGGDGTLSLTINYLVGYPDPPPLAVIPLGTANDFAGGIGIDSVETGIERAVSGRIQGVDVGKVNDAFFINVAAGGFLCDVAHNTDRRLKRTLGRMAYFLKGLLELSLVKAIDLEVWVEGQKSFAGEAFLFLILNTQAAGSFRSLAPKALPGDGIMDLIVVKKCSGPELMGVLLKAAAGRHITDPNILYLQGKEFRLASPAGVVTDLDGEEGPSLPWQVEILPQKLSFLF